MYGIEGNLDRCDCGVDLGNELQTEKLQWVNLGRNLRYSEPVYEEFTRSDVPEHPSQKTVTKVNHLTFNRYCNSVTFSEEGRPVALISEIL